MDELEQAVLMYVNIALRGTLNLLDSMHLNSLRMMSGEWALGLEKSVTYLNLLKAGCGFSTRFHFTAKHENYHSSDSGSSTGGIFTPQGTFGDALRHFDCYHWNKEGDGG